MKYNIFNEIENLIQYALNKKFIVEDDIIFIRNRLHYTLKIKEVKDADSNHSDEDLANTLENLTDWAVKTNIIKDNIIEKDLFDTEIMGLITPKPSEIINKFNEIRINKNIRYATNFYYQFSKDTNYIRTDRIDKDIGWKTKTEFGELEITINIAKPEKDPKLIVKQKNEKNLQYPKCPLCIENVGFQGNISKPARQNHRVIPIKLADENWYLQYSPYVYYNEHCICLNRNHIPMKINKKTFIKLFDFVDKIPHYFIGSNADLLIVGGSILNHDHFQGGSHTFPIERASIESIYMHNKFKETEVEILKWPLSVIRLSGNNKYEIIQFADYIFNKWISYSDEESEIYAYTNHERHNTITPIVRKKKDKYEIDLVLRNNKTSEAHPFGIFHPHKDKHNIKKENIGLIEVMGRAILPSRLVNEIEVIKDFIQNKKIEDKHILDKHAQLTNAVIKNYTKTELECNIDKIIKKEIGLVFKEVLKDAGVFKCNVKGLQAFDKFLKNCGMEEKE